MLGGEHPHTLTSVSNLASVLQNQGKYEAAEEINRRALEKYKKMLGAEHPNTLTSVYYLTYILHSKGQYDAASKLYQRAITGYQKTLGSHHPTSLAYFGHYSSILDELKERGPSDRDWPVASKTTKRQITIWRWTIKHMWPCLESNWRSPRDYPSILPDF